MNQPFPGDRKEDGMKDREKILRYFAASGEESKDMAMRLLDLADSVDRGRPNMVARSS